MARLMGGLRAGARQTEVARHRSVGGCPSTVDGHRVQSDATPIPPEYLLRSG